MRRWAGLLAVVGVVAAGCSSGEPAPVGAPTTRADYSRALLTYDTLPTGYFVANDDTFFRTQGPQAREELLQSFSIPVGPPDPADPPLCDLRLPYDDDGPYALVTALDQTTRLVLVQTVGPAAVDLGDLRAAAQACPVSTFRRLTVTSQVLPDPDVAADAVLALRFETNRDEQGDEASRLGGQVLALASVGPVLVGVMLFGDRGSMVDAAVVADALTAAVDRTRATFG